VHVRPASAADALHFDLEWLFGRHHPPGRMKSIAILAAALCLTAAAVQGRADETNASAVIIGAAQAKTHIGKQVTVTGIVAQVSIRPSLIFLNFDKPYPDNPFTAIVRNSHTNEFEKLPALKAKHVSVQGQVKDYNGKPEMELTSKSQLKLLSGTN
jgi:DNA/RNA endonuclease YhcR with UshA esterase domain